MADTLADIAVLAEDPLWRKNVTAAMVRVCAQIIKEAQDAASPSPRDKLRRDLAVQAIEQREVYADRFAWALAQVPTVTAASSDAQLLGATRVAVDYLARLPI